MGNLSDSDGSRTHNDLVRKQAINHLAKPAKWLIPVLSTVHLTVCSYNVIYVFQSQSTLYSCLNIKKHLVWNRCDIWNSNASCCSNLNSRYHTCFEQRAPCHSGNYRVWIHSETLTSWCGKNIQLNILCLELCYLEIFSC